MYYESSNVNPPSMVERKVLTEIIKSSGLVVSTARISLLHYFRTHQIPVMASDLSIINELPLSTTYRNLSELANVGLVDYMIDRSGIYRWYLVNKNKISHCPVCNQEFH